MVARIVSLPLLRCSLCNRRVIVWYELKSSQFHFEMSESVTPTGIAASNSKLPSREPYIRGVLPSNFLYNGIRIFLDQLSYRDLLRYPPDFIFPCWIIFFCFPCVTFGVPEPSRIVRKTAKTEKKLNGCWWLHRRFSESRELFYSWRFSKDCFSRNVQHKIIFQNINFFFLHLERGTEKRAQSQKRVFWNKKTTLKLK